MSLKIYRLSIILFGLWILFDFSSSLVANIFWFQEVGYLSVFITKLKTQFTLWLGVGSISSVFLGLNLRLAHRLKQTINKNDQNLLKKIQVSGKQNDPIVSSTLKLRSLLPLLIGLSLLIGLMLLYYGQISLEFWHYDLAKPRINSRIHPFGLAVLKPLVTQTWQVGILIGLVTIILINPTFWLSAIAILFSLSFCWIISEQWVTVLQYFKVTSFNTNDALFHRDISFYIFNLPLIQILEFWFWGLALYGLISVSLVYLLSGDSLSQGRFLGFSKEQKRHLYSLGSFAMLILSLRYWLDRYQLLYSNRGIVYGASYTDINVQLKVDTGLSLVSGAIALFLLLTFLLKFRTLSKNQKQLPFLILLVSFTFIFFNWILPQAIQKLGVQPNELARERPYIERTIAATRGGFALNKIEVKTFNPEGNLNTATLEKNALTIRNIRLWDTRPLLESNRQLQQIRLYYQFPDADIDRYRLQPETKIETPNDNQQVIIAARELDYSAVPKQAKTWVNQHLVYTHGYGYTLSPVNQVAAGGLPDYFVKDIGTNISDNQALKTKSDRIRASIPIGTPRIYYGEITNNYIMTSTKVTELDYPSGDENVYNLYDGKGGIEIGQGWKRLIFAQYLRDWQMLFTKNFTDKTRLLFRRNIKQRVRAIAPFLRYDRDPYLVVADTGTSPRYLYWIVDAYTTSDRYPYSDPNNLNFNYIRNSVKVVIDAYNGDINFYVADPNDPIITSYAAIFPQLFKPISALPTALQTHLRYPTDFFQIQSERLLSYHMTDAQVFYNREDQWQIPREIYGTQPRPVEPYYLIMKLPTATAEEFILLLPFTPTERTNLIAWLAARSDGEDYGKLLLYQFPKQKLVYGTEQIEALINQDPVISQQISLWNRQGSKALQGNLLVIPIEQSLLYVEPVYLEAEQNSLPTLVRVIVVYENRIVMAETLEQALKTVFQSDKPTPAIVRPVGSEER